VFAYPLENTPDGEDGLNYLCSGYKQFFTHIAPYMKFMGRQLQNGLPPASIMHYVRGQDRIKTGRALDGPNDPCPCGSGRKLKKRCGAAA